MDKIAGPAVVTTSVMSDERGVAVMRGELWC